MFKYAFLGAVIFAFLVPGAAAAAEAIEVGNLFTWATGSTIPDWGRGGLYAALGLIGALVTVFTLIGGAVPGTAGFARIETGLKRVEERLCRAQSSRGRCYGKAQGGIKQAGAGRAFG